MATKSVAVPPSNLAPRPPKRLGFWATLGAIVGGSAAYALGCDGPTCAAAAGLAAFSVRIALIDLKLRVIRDLDVAGMFGIGLAWVIWTTPGPAHALICVLIRSLMYAVGLQVIRLAFGRLRGREGLGFGDVKLAAVAGPFLSIELFSLAMTTAAILGIFYFILLKSIRLREINRYTYVPLGAFMAPCFLVFWLASA